mgnify:CR=1 FL=1
MATLFTLNIVFSNKEIQMQFITKPISTIQKVESFVFKLSIKISIL